MDHEAAAAPETSPQHTPHLLAGAADASFPQEIIQMNKQQQLQQEILLQHFQQQRQQLAQEHEHQLRHYLKMNKQQQLQQEILLQHFQQQRQQLAQEHEHQLRHYLKGHRKVIVKSSSGESITSTGTARSHPYRLPAPLTLPVAGLPQYSLADYTHKKTDCKGSTERGSTAGVGASALIREEEEAERAPELLFSSPSTPNISLGRVHQPVQPPRTPVPVSLPPVSEAEAYSGSAADGGAAHLHQYLRDQIRKIVLTRAHGPAAAPALREEEGVVLDLTTYRSKTPKLPPQPPAGRAPLTRTLPSPLVGARMPPTGLAYDALMLKHGCGCGVHAPMHPEHGGRLQLLWVRLCKTGLAARSERTRPRKATFEELQSVHSEAHVMLYGGRARKGGVGGVRKLVQLACGRLGVDSDTTWSDAHTAPAARMAAGAVLDLALRVARNELRNGFAVVRPPGHHAEPSQAMGFCFFNNVAVAARNLHQKMHLQRILIVDWDIHHGNGTQQMFYSDPHVLYMSLHRYDDGNFFPGTGAASECGAAAGLGFNVNVAWGGGGGEPPLADAEYLAAFRTLIMPIAKEYNPELVLVSCGFDAASGHPAPLGGYNVSAACFAAMTRDLMQLANGKVVLSLEGGYNLAAVCDCAEECVRALLGAPLPAPPSYAEMARRPAPHAQQALHQALQVQAAYWPEVKRYAKLINMSALEAARLGRLQTERDAAAATALAMASIS